MGVVVVIVALGIAVWREIADDPHGCIQRSLSAYYYTPVRPVFAGALIVIGFSMAVMWGKTFLEDAVLNLAGLLLTVVALNPTLDAAYCNVDEDVAGKPIPSDETQLITPSDLIDANAATISRGIFALLVVLTVLLVVIAIAGTVAYDHSVPGRRPSETARRGYIVTWSLAALVVLAYWLLFWDANNRPVPWKDGSDTVNEGSMFYHQVHGWSANIAVFLIFVAVVSAARGKLPPPAVPPAPWWKPWKWRILAWHVWRPRWWWHWRAWQVWTNRWAGMYAACAASMAVVALILKGGDAAGLYSWWGWMNEHATFVVEAVLILLIGVFWVIQTFDRRSEGAPHY